MSIFQNLTLVEQSQKLRHIIKLIERNLNSSVTSLTFTVYDYLTSACHPCHQSVFEFWLVENKLHNNRLHKVEVLLPKGREVEEMKELEGIEKAKELQEEGMSKGRGGGRKA